MKYWILVGLLQVLSLSALAEGDIKATASATEVLPDQEIEITYTIENAAVSRFIPPDFSPFQVTYGPAKAQNFSVINGRISRTVSFTYGIMPTRQGKFTIGSATATVNGDPVRSNTITITVNTGSGSNIPGQKYPDAPARNDAWGDKIFVLVTADKQKVWEGEQVVLTYSLFYQVNFDNVQILNTPSYNGFLLHDFKVGQPPEQVVNYKGKQYYTQLFKRVALFPNQDGHITVPPIELECTVFEEIKDPVFDDPFFRRSREKKIVLRSNALDIEVNPLPVDGRPADFKGAVGQYTLEAALDNSSIAIGDGATLKAIVRGAGNLHLVQLGKPEITTGIDVYDPKVKEQISSDSRQLSGSKSFEFVLIPSDTGDYIIPPLSFSYFDPETGSYKTINTSSEQLQVVQGNNAEPDVDNEPKSGWKPLLRLVLKVVGYGIVIALAVLLVIGLILLTVYRRKKKSKKKLIDKVIVREAEVVNPLSDRQDKTRAVNTRSSYEDMLSAFQSGDEETFYKLLPRVICEVAIQEGLIADAAYDRTKLLTAMKVFSAEAAYEAEQLLSNAEANLYGGGNGNATMAADKDTLDKLITRIRRA